VQRSAEAGVHVGTLASCEAHEPKRSSVLGDRKGEQLECAEQPYFALPVLYISVRNNNTNDKSVWDSENKADAWEMRIIPEQMHSEIGRQAKPTKLFGS
jgi:hypothetical protein